MAHALADAPASPSAAAAIRWGDLRTRALSAAVLAPVALGCLWVGGWAWSALILLVAVGLAHEWLGLFRGRGREMRLLALAGVPYVGLATLALLWVRADPAVGRANMLFLVLVVWASDIGAYVVGRMVGGPKLAPAISPGKTWSGAAGALVAAVAVGGCVAAADGGAAVSVGVVTVAIVLSVVEQAGDLLESWLKRRLGVKDSGRIIPGHGGLFDRLDGLLIAAPVAALLAVALGRGVELWR